MTVEAKIYAYHLEDNKKKVFVDIVDETGKYYSEDATDVFVGISGKKIQPRKVARSLRKKVLGLEFCAVKGDVPGKLNSVLHKTLVA